MNLKTLSNQSLSLLVSAASPGSALAHQLGVATFEPMLLRRGKEEPSATPEMAGATTALASPARVRAPSADAWLTRLFDRLENWAWDRQQQEREAYLAQSHDLHDLEYRMRQLDGDMVSRGCMLR